MLICYTLPNPNGFSKSNFLAPVFRFSVDFLCLTCIRASGAFATFWPRPVQWNSSSAQEESPRVVAALPCPPVTLWVSFWLDGGFWRQPELVLGVEVETKVLFPPQMIVLRLASVTWHCASCVWMRSVSKWVFFRQSFQLYIFLKWPATNILQRLQGLSCYGLQGRQVGVIFEWSALATKVLRSWGLDQRFLQWVWESLDFFSSLLLSCWLLVSTAPCLTAISASLWLLWDPSYFWYSRLLRSYDERLPCGHLVPRY